MSTNYANVNVFTVTDDKQLIRRPGNPFCVKLSDEQDNLLISFKINESNNCDKGDGDFSFYKDSEISRFNNDSLVIHNGSVTLVLSFNNPSESTMFNKILTDFKLGAKSSVFSQRTDEASASQYFQFYGYLSQQQNMMQDYIRTSTYQRAILGNTDDFRDAVVLDVGAGSGILSFFAAQAGARKVYAVEASSMAKHAEQLVFHNKLQNKIIVIPGKIEEINLPEKVDIIISEPMGYMLFNERMLETYLHAKKWLQPNGKMFPTLGDLHIAPFSDAALYMEQLNKANFWYQENFHGVDLTVLRTAAVKEYFRQPVVDTFDIRICMARSHRYTVDFQTAPETDLHLIEIPFSFVMQHTADIHGLAFWFDVAFIGQNQTVWLSTSPTQPLTHWYQVRCLVDTPIFCTAGQILTGRVTLRSNKRQSYDVDIELNLEGTTRHAVNSLDLKNPYFRYTGQTQQPPPGAHETSPTEQYWQSMENNQAMNGVMNGNSGVVLMDMSGIHPNVQSSGQLTAGSVQPTQQHPHVQQQQPHQQIQQQGTGNLNMIGQQPHQSSLVNLGSMPSPGANNRSNPSRIPVSSAVPPSSIGGGITPSMFTPNPSVSVLNTTTFPFKDQETNNNNFSYYYGNQQDHHHVVHQNNNNNQQHHQNHLQQQSQPLIQPQLPQMQQLEPLQIEMQSVTSGITYQDISSPSSSSSSSAN